MRGYEVYDGYVTIGHPLSDAQREMLRNIGLEKELRYFDGVYMEVLKALLRKYFAAVVVNTFHVPLEIYELRRLTSDILLFDFDVRVFRSPDVAKEWGDIVVFEGTEIDSVDSDNCGDSGTMAVGRGGACWSYRAVRLLSLTGFVPTTHVICEVVQ